MNLLDMCGLFSVLDARLFVAGHPLHLWWLAACLMIDLCNALGKINHCSKLRWITVTEMTVYITPVV